MDIDNNFEIEIRGSGNSIAIQAISLINYNSNLDWDKNWVKTKITATGGVFSGTYEADLTTFDFENLKQDLNSLYENLNGEIEFSDLEGFLKLEIKGDNTGNFNIQVTCNDQPGIYTSELVFEINFDQTYIKNLVNKLNNITRQFPIVGNFENKNNYNV